MRALEALSVASARQRVQLERGSPVPGGCKLAYLAQKASPGPAFQYVVRAQKVRGMFAHRKLLGGTMSDSKARESGLSAHRGLCIRLTLERVVKVRMASTQKLHKTGCYIEREEKNAPTLVLLDMDELVGADALQERVIEANDDVAESYRGEAGTTR